MATGGKVVECVPNFSEGRRRHVIDAIAGALRGTEGCSLLDVDAGESTNRTVYTFVGRPAAVLEGAMNAARAAFKLIDMRKHKGEHPRLGAMDVCPFVPVANVTMEECAELSRQLGERLATELHVPVFLYESAVPDDGRHDYRKTLPQIRAGEYEGLQEKLQSPEWSPDFGPAEFVPSWGATVTGARKFLIAYNVNLLGTKEQAHRIALNIREQGRPTKPGRLKAVKAIGWYLDEHDLAQVSINLCDFETTPLHVVYEAVCHDAKELNLAVTGSEIVGLVPREALLAAAEFYMQRENLFILHEAQKMRLAVSRLGLSSLSEFRLDLKIIEYRVSSNPDGPLLSSSLRSFIESLSARTSAPGGGSASAVSASMVREREGGRGRGREGEGEAFIESLAARTSAPGGGSASAVSASMGAALGTMVGLMTFGKKKYESLDDIMRKTIGALHGNLQTMLPLVDKDSEAFADYMVAMKLPQNTEEEKTKRLEAMETGMKQAISVPLSLMRTAHSCWPHLLTLATHGNTQTMSDLQVSARTLEAGVHGGHYNILINLPYITDGCYATSVKEEAVGLARESVENCSAVLKAIDQRLNQ